MAEIEFNDVTKRYADGFEAVKRLNLDVADGELMILVGPSGCGKIDGAADGRRARDDHRRRDRIGGAWSTTCAPRTATSRWCSRTTRSTRT